jgi:hypothetical protein
MFGIGQVYFLLINGTMLTILKFIFVHANFENYTDQCPPIVFNKFSVQWLCLALMPLLFPLFFINKISVLVSIARLGTVALYCYILFIIYIFGQSVQNGRVASEWKNEMH